MSLLGGNLAQCGRDAVRLSPYAFVGFFLGLVVVVSFRVRTRRRKQKAAVTRVRMGVQAEERRAALRAKLPFYRSAIARLSDALDMDPDEVGRRFSERFLRSANLDVGLAAAFDESPRFGCFGFRDLDGFQAFSDRVHQALGLTPPFVFDPTGHDVPVEAGVRLFAQSLEATGYALLFFGSDSDSYCLFVLDREAAREVLELTKQPDLEEDSSLRVEILR